MLENRESIETEYRVVDGIIRNPGKFEACAVFAPYYYGLALDGMASQVVYESDGTPVDVFEVESRDVSMFPELDGAEAVAVWTDDSGFVYVESVTWTDVHALECEDYAPAEL